MIWLDKFDYAYYMYYVSIIRTSIWNIKQNTQEISSTNLLFLLLFK